MSPTVVKGAVLFQKLHTKQTDEGAQEHGARERTARQAPDDRAREACLLALYKRVDQRILCMYVCVCMYVCMYVCMSQRLRRSRRKCPSAGQRAVRQGLQCDIGCCGEGSTLARQARTSRQPTGLTLDSHRWERMQEGRGFEVPRRGAAGARATWVKFIAEPAPKQITHRQNTNNKQARRITPQPERPHWSYTVAEEALRL